MEGRPFSAPLSTSLSSWKHETLYTRYAGGIWGDTRATTLVLQHETLWSQRGRKRHMHRYSHQVSRFSNTQLELRPSRKE